MLPPFSGLTALSFDEVFFIDAIFFEKSEFELKIEELEKDGWWPVGWEKENFLDGIEDKEILTSELVGRDLDQTIKKNKEK